MSTRIRPAPVPPALAARGLAATFLAAMLLGTPAARAGAPEAYRLDVGDVIEISVAGLPEMRQRLPIQMDGTVSYPYLGRVPVAGSTLGTVLRETQAVLSSQIYRQRLADGRDVVVTVEPREIAVNVVEYRPVYVSGDVARPGEQPYRPLMTLRQAVSVAGGYDLVRTGARLPAVEMADARAEQDAVTADLAKEMANIARLRQALGDKDSGAKDPGVKAAAAALPLPRPVLAELQKSQADLLDADQGDHLRERVFLRRGVDQLTAQSEVLARQQRDEEQGVKVDTEELDRLAALLAKGAVVAQRVTEARRALLLSSTRSLQTTAQLMQATRQKEEIGRQLERLDDTRRIKLITELSERSIRAQQLRARLQGLETKLGSLAARPVDDSGAARRPSLAIVRRAPGGPPQRVVAEEDTPLSPGDVVEVSLRAATSLSALSP